MSVGRKKKGLEGGCLCRDQEGGGKMEASEGELRKAECEEGNGDR